MLTLLAPAALGYAMARGGAGSHAAYAAAPPTQGAAATSEAVAAMPAAGGAGRSITIQAVPRPSTTEADKDAPAGAAAGESPASNDPHRGPHTTPNVEGFLPVVTDSIPAPTRTFALSARVPGTTNMQPAAAAAVQRATADARRRGVTIRIRSAWRSEQFQRELFRRAVARYGSASAAARWVLAPEESAHVKGYAVDVEPRSAGRWLEQHGAAYGLCRTYDNEWWHFEYLATARCPARQPSAAG